ncbi:MAG: hypothetical protein K2X27_02495 [Candidatus Obscuribacterales bacterium]|nr:hypothetical protein [Candidatus Obscuribacterales bacterium]
MSETQSLNTKTTEANESIQGGIYFSPPRLDAFNIPGSHEERLEWVRKSCERFFEKVREYDALKGLAELN